ncbi:hypothetical protein CFC21_055785 [Triticum aestivum]|uniref:Uncharacterized protein n=2 Tax=Triticum aestivum TaxID=4565 RepID=A0A9R1GFY2_WHEAT|nr:hypothetical protein CFC21_055785 [Triticum aestivum]
MNAPEHLYLALFMLGRGVQVCVSESYISAELSTLPEESAPPTTYAFSPTLADPNQNRGVFIASASASPVHELVRMLYLKATFPRSPNTSSSVPTASDSRMEELSAGGILGTWIQHPVDGS